MANIPTLKANAIWFLHRILPDFQRTANANIPHIVPHIVTEGTLLNYFYHVYLKKNFLTKPSM